MAEFMWFQLLVLFIFSTMSFGVIVGCLVASKVAKYFNL